MKIKDYQKYVGDIKRSFQEKNVPINGDIISIIIQ
jgi:hypothetical protein